MKARLAAWAILPIAVAGCATLEPAYVRPPAAVPPAWPQGPAYAPAQAGPDPATLGWRTFFTDPKLQSVIELTLAQNRDLRVAVANIEAARAQYRVQASELAPTVTASAQASFARSAGAERQVYTAQLATAGYELDLFGRVRSLTHAALEQFLATDEARRAIQLSLIGEAASDYFTLAADRQLLSVAKETLTAQQASLELTRARFGAGAASRLDVDQAETTVEQARADVAQFTTAAAQDKNALDLVAGAPTPDPLLPSGLPEPAGAIADLPAGVSSAVLLRRPDVLEAEHRLRGADADIGAARAAFFPTISLTGAGGASASSLSSLFSPVSRIWSFVPNLSIPIFTAGRNRANLRYAEAQQHALTAAYDKAVQTGFREVADALARRGTIGEQLSAQTALVTAAADALRLSDARYRRGTDSYLNVLDAQRTLYGAQRTLVSTRLAELTNAVSLYGALGGGLTP